VVINTKTLIIENITNNMLQELEIYIQNMRENGDTDLRSIIHIIKKMQLDPDYYLTINEKF
jgi:hypothetical protein